MEVFESFSCEVRLVGPDLRSCSPRGTFPGNKGLGFSSLRLLDKVDVNVQVECGA